MCSPVVCSKSFFHVTRLRRDDKKRQKMLSLRKAELVTRQTFFQYCPISINKNRRKDLYVDNKVQKIVGDVYCPACKKGKCVYFSTNETSSFHDCKKCKTCCHVLNIPFKDPKLTIMLFGDDSTHCFVKKASGNHENEKQSRFRRNSSASDNQPYPNLSQKR